MWSVAEVRAERMRSLLLDGTRVRSVEECVSWCGAMQAQELSSVQWSLGLRIAARGSGDDAATPVTLAEVEDAMEQRQVLRTWPMRGTIHLIPSGDARWMLDLMGGKPLAGAAKRRQYLGLTDDDAARTLEVLAEELRGARLTRAEVLDTLTAAGVPADGQAGYHLLWFAAQSGLTCIAPHLDGNQTFALLEEWAPEQVSLTRPQALATIARRFVRSHGPVAVKDLARWTGLGIRDCRAGLAEAGDSVREIETEAGPMWVSGSTTGAPNPGDRGWVAPPGFDEFMLGYADRSAMVSPDHFQHVVPGKNGVFRATLVRDGTVVATWKPDKKAGRVVIEVAPFGRLGARDRRNAEHALTPYGTFVGQPVEVKWI